MLALLSLMLLSCTRSEGEFADCSDAACRRDWALRTWKQSPEAVARAVAAHDDPIEQMAIIQALSEAHTGQIASLCEALEAGAVQDQCRKLHQRPHLSVDPTQRTPQDQREGRGVFMDLVVGAGLRSPFEQVAPVAAACAPGVLSQVCQTEQAERQASEGAVQAAAAACNAIADLKWRNECFFTASEAATVIRKSTKIAMHRVPVAVDLCLGSGPYTGMCFSHLYSTIAFTAPAASQGAATWTPVMEATRRARDAMAQHSTALAERLEDRIWAEALWRAYLRAEVVSGIPLMVLPQAAHPHVRAAAAWRVVSDGPPATSLSAVVSALSTALSSQTKSGQLPLKRLPDDLPIRWRESLPAEQGLPWVHYLEDLRRTVSSDPDADLAICILEAAARMKPALSPLLIDGLHHTDERVRWTAARLLSEDPASRAQLAALADDPSALVRARAPSFAP